MDKRITFGELYDTSADIYSMGLLFYFIFKGRGIFDDCGSVPQIERKRSSINAHFEESMEEYLEDVPLLMAKVITNCLHPDPAKRYKAY